MLVNLIGGSTTADILGSWIDTTLDGGTIPAGYVVPDVFVNASSHAFAGDFVVAVAVSGYAGLAGAADAANVERTTTAYVSGGQIGSIVQSAPSITIAYTPSGSGSGEGSEQNSTLTITTLTPVPSIGTVTVNAATTADTADIARWCRRGVWVGGRYGRR